MDFTGFTSSLRWSRLSSVTRTWEFANIYCSKCRRQCGRAAAAARAALPDCSGMSAGDMSQKNYKQYDLETWMPSRNSYGKHIRLRCCLISSQTLAYPVIATKWGASKFAICFSTLNNTMVPRSAFSSVTGELISLKMAHEQSRCAAALI